MEKVTELSGYRQGIIHLAWLRDDQTRFLLFGMVQLLPAEFPDARGCLPKCLRAKPRSRKYLHYRRFAGSAAAALDWYRSAVSGDPVTLPHDGYRTPGDGARLESGPFLQEPPWTHLVTSKDLSFAPDWMNCSRTHFLIRKDPVPPFVSEIVQVNENRAMLKEWLNFDIVDAYRDYQGSICLVAPNPVYRSIERSHLEQPRTRSAETVAYKVVARQGQHSSGLSMEIVNERPRGRMSSVFHTFADEAIAVLEFSAEVYKEGRAVTHSQHGLLEWHEPLPLIRSIRTRMGLIQGRKRVRVPAGGRGRPAYEYDVEQTSNEETLVSGGRSNDVISRLLEGDNRRSRRKAAKVYDQMWFYRSHHDATQYVRRVIGGARATVLIVDPYFSGRDLLAFGHAVQRRDVPLRILTSIRAFDEMANGGSCASESLLVEMLNTMFKDRLVSPEVRVLTGSPAVHDRFLVVDADVWFSGNSLNTIGERAGMLVRVPDPEPVIERLEAFWRAARALTQGSEIVQSDP